MKNYFGAGQKRIEFAIGDFKCVTVEENLRFKKNVRKKVIAGNFLCFQLAHIKIIFIALSISMCKMF